MVGSTKFSTLLFSTLFMAICEKQIFLDKAKSTLSHAGSFSELFTNHPVLTVKYTHGKPLGCGFVCCCEIGPGYLPFQGKIKQKGQKKKMTFLKAAFTTSRRRRQNFRDGSSFRTFFEGLESILNLKRISKPIGHRCFQVQLLCRSGQKLKIFFDK